MLLDIKAMVETTNTKQNNFILFPFIPNGYHNKNEELEARAFQKMKANSF
jgi:hypothetical protein